MKLSTIKHFKCKNNVLIEANWRAAMQLAGHVRLAGCLTQIMPNDAKV